MPDVNAPWAILPVKPFACAKRRLEGALTPAERAALARGFMATCLSALIESNSLGRVYVISRDADALAMARDRGAGTIAEGPPGDLNTAILTAREQAFADEAGRFLVIASDLPLVAPEDIQRLVAASVTASAVIVPDRRAEGTNALLLSPPDLIEPAFGTGSFSRHMTQLARVGATVAVLRIKGIAFDMDTPEDLAGLSRQPS